MNLEVWGLGYAGLVCASGLAQQGHRVTGVDIDPKKVASVNAGEAHFREPGLAARVAEVAASGRLRAVAPDAIDAKPPDASILCLSTPPTDRGELDTRLIFDVAPLLSRRIRGASSFSVVVVRSTVPVHFTRGPLTRFLESRSGKTAGIDFGLAMAPEFLREGNAIDDFDDPSLIVLGTDDAKSRAAIEPVFHSDRWPVHHVSSSTAEFFKLTNNAFHSLKISFANELARLAHGQGIDGNEILHMICQDPRLNMSRAYLDPGFAFGGACLEKDLVALRMLAEPSGVPLLSAVSASNAAHLDACLRAIGARSYARLGLYGISNKAGSDDLRYSPVLALLDALNARPETLWVCDPDLDPRQSAFLHDAYGATLVADLPSLEREVDLIVNFRRQALALSRDVPQIHFANFWRGDAQEPRSAGPASAA
jgi:GDP-mannose 6-dehydrogenase